MLRNQKQEKKDRLQCKTLDAEFARSVQKGLGCSGFEAEAIVKLAKATYQSDGQTKTLRPGQMIVTVISELEGARRKIREAAMVRVVITIDDPGDVALREHFGSDELRRHRLVRVCQETLEQGGLMTVEDLAYRIFNVGERTVVRDLAILRTQGIVVPLRSTIRDIGRTVTHKEQIIHWWLAGKQYDYISRAVHHSTAAIRNYVETFKRAVALDREGHTITNIAFLIGASPTLVKTYLQLWEKERPGAIKSRVAEIEQPNSWLKYEVKSPSKRGEKKGGVDI